MMHRPFEIEIEIVLPDQPFCEKHSARMAPYGDIFKLYLCAYALHRLYHQRRIGLPLSAPEIATELATVTPLCCFVGDERFAEIERLLVQAAAQNGPSV